MVICAIKDTKVGGFQMQVVEHNTFDFMRGMKIAASDKKSVYGMYPEDYECWQLGEIEGDIVTPKKEFLINCLQLIGEKRETDNANNQKPIPSA